MPALIASTNITLDNTSAINIPGTPVSGQTVLYPKADKLLYYKDDAGVERRVDAGLGYMLVRDEKAVGTAGGSTSGGITYQRALNTVTSNTISGASLAANQITLPAGTYVISGSAPSRDSGLTKADLYNTTDSANAIIGVSYGGVADQTNQLFSGLVVIATTKVFEVRHYIGSGLTTNGLGTAVNVAAMGVEVYTTVTITREA